MKRTHFIVTSTAMAGSMLSLTAARGLASAMSDASLDAIITTEFNTAKTAVAGTKLMITDSGTNLAYGDGTIAISRAFIRQYLAAAGESETRQMTRFLIAHELAHELQFRRYGGFSAVAQNADVETRIGYEAQADIFAAQYLYLKFQGPNRPSNEAIVNALQLGFDMGDEDNSSQDHPNHDHRRNGVRYGLASGALVIAATLAASNSQFAESEEVLRGSLDFEGNDFPSWALRSARKINHWHIDPKDISIAAGNIDDQTDPQKFTYAIALANAGTSQLVLDCSVQSISYPRGAPHDGAGSLLMGSQRSVASLAPGQTKAISGSLLRREDAHYQAELIFPPDSRALFATFSV
jgi:hypothetical protein